jgi:tRNA C32,U32 (ribose-2'-O)-methylase TrmJ
MSPWVPQSGSAFTAIPPSRGNNRTAASKNFGKVATALPPPPSRKKAIPLDALPIDQPVALAFGTEEEGLSSELLDGADLHVRIPMFGFTQSFNISVSAALCLYDLRHRLNTSSLNWQLSSARQRAVYRGWLRNSIRRCEEIEAVFLRENYPTELGGL